MNWHGLICIQVLQFQEINFKSNECVLCINNSLRLERKYAGVSFFHGHYLFQKGTVFRENSSMKTASVIIVQIFSRHAQFSKIKELHSDIPQF